MAFRGSLVALMMAATVFGCGRMNYDSLYDLDDGRDDDSEGAFSVFVGIEGASGGYLLPLAYDPSSPASSAISEPETTLRLDALGTRLRSVAWQGDSTILVGSGTTRLVVPVTINPMAQGAAIVFSAEDIEDTHGLCVLPNGNLIAGEFTVSSGNAVVELEAASGSYQFVRPVYTTTVERGVLGMCTAVSNTELYLSDMNATESVDGDLVRLSFVGNSWVETDRFDMSAFGTATYGVHTSAVWSFVIHDNGFIYVFPDRRSGTRIPNLIRCPVSDLDVSGCTLLGVLPADSGGPGNEQSLMGAVAVPGTQHLLFVTGRMLYRYDLETDQFESLFDFAALALTDGNGNPDQVAAARHVLVH